MEQSVRGVSTPDGKSISLTIRKPLMADGDGDSEPWGEDEIDVNRDSKLVKAPDFWPAPK
jgi:hypothetical protein